MGPPTGPPGVLRTSQCPRSFGATFLADGSKKDLGSGLKEALLPDMLGVAGCNFPQRQAIIVRSQRRTYPRIYAAGRSQTFGQAESLRYSRQECLRYGRVAQTFESAVLPTFQWAGPPSGAM
jgi:hypothetical protein